MRSQVRWLSAGLVLLLTSICLLPNGVVRAGGKEDMVENPFYKFWSSFKKGASSVYLERTKAGGPDSKTVQDGFEEKHIAYKLLDVTEKQVVVETVVTEREFFGQVQTAPTKQIYPAKITKERMERFLSQTGAKAGEDTVKHKGMELKCKTIKGNVKAASGEVTEYQLWLSDEVPGSIVKQISTTRHKGELVAETTITLESFKKGK